jgi:hypothetical protein
MLEPARTRNSTLPAPPARPKSIASFCRVFRDYNNPIRRTWEIVEVHSSKRATSDLRICGSARAELLLDGIAHTPDSRSQPTDVSGMKQPDILHRREVLRFDQFYASA